MAKILADLQRQSGANDLPKSILITSSASDAKFTNANANPNPNPNPKSKGTEPKGHF